MGKLLKRINREATRLIDQNKQVLKHGNVSDILIGLKFADSHVHVHCPDNNALIQMMKRAGQQQAIEFLPQEPQQKEPVSAQKPAEISKVTIQRSVTDDVEKSDTTQEDSTEPRKIIFKHSRAAGDGLMFSAGVRDFCLLFPEIKVNVDSNQGWIWENNPYIDRSVKKGDTGVEYYSVGYPAVGYVNNTNIHFTSMFLLDMIAIADLHKDLHMPLGEFCSTFAQGEVGDKCIGNIKKHPKIAEPEFVKLFDKYRNFCKTYSRQWGDLHLTEDEKKHNLIKETYEVNKYWLIAPGGKRDCTAKIWDWRKFQDVIDHFEGKLKFVMIGKSDLLIEPLKNIINLVDKFNDGMRPLVSLAYHAAGCVSGPSFLMHLAAAMPPGKDKERKPCVTILGGREPAAWTWYCNHQVLHTNGAFSCCDNGGCWKARTFPMQKDKKHNKNLCHQPIQTDGRTVQRCMDSITSADVIRAIEKYYDGDIYTYSRTVTKKKKQVLIPEVISTIPEVTDIASTIVGTTKEINILGNLNTDGGGEQSMMKIASLLQKDGWKINIWPWGSVHKAFQDNGAPIMKQSFMEDHGKSMEQHMKSGLPLLFYANDCVWDFPKFAEGIVKKSSALIVGINYMLGGFKDCEWLAQSGKLKAVIFQNEEKLEEWDTQTIGYNGTQKIVLYGAIDLDKYYEVCPPEKEKGDLVVLKHCKPDYRKWVTEESKNQGKKIHVWQQKVFKETDVKFYGRLLKATKNIRFEFMEAHKEVADAFRDEPRMVFHKWNSMDVGDFLGLGHVYLYRTSNAWRDQYPRVVGEALAAGLPVLTEPRDGTKDRVIHGDTGFYCVDYDGYLYALKMLQRKEDYRHKMGMYAKDWAKSHLDPGRWVELVNELAQI